MKLVRSCLPSVCALLLACGPGRITGYGEGSESSSSSTDEGEGEVGEDWVDGEDDGEWDEGDEPTTGEDGDGDGDWDSTDDEGDGDGEPSGAPNGAACTQDLECASSNCYIIPFLGGQCGECNEDSDCVAGGCTPQNPFEVEGSVCNFGEIGGGCETSGACEPGLTCELVFDLLGIVEFESCSECGGDLVCGPGAICAPLFQFDQWAGQQACISPGSLAQDAYCVLEGNGDQACASGICSVVDVMGLAQMGACGECQTDQDCGGGTCQLGQLQIETGELFGSICL